MSDKTVYFFDYSILFLQDYLPKCGRSVHTICSYRDILTIFKNWLVETGKDFTKIEFKDVSVDLVHDFLDALKTNKGSSVTTCNHRLIGIKAYVDYCVTKDVSLASVRTLLNRVKPYKVPVTIKKILTSEQVTLLIDMCPNTYKGARNKMILLLIYETAVRISELSGLKMENVYLDKKSPFILLMGKGKKERTIPLLVKTAELLEKYINDYVRPAGSEYIFFTMHGGEPSRISNRSIQEMIDVCADKARELDPSIPESVHPHMFRRSKATSLYRNGMQLERVSALLGHSGLETTRIYAKASVEQIRESMEKATPKNDLLATPIWEGKTKDLAKTYGLR